MRGYARFSPRMNGDVRSSCTCCLTLAATFRTVSHESPAGLSTKRSRRAVRRRARPRRASENHEDEEQDERQARERPRAPRRRTTAAASPRTRSTRRSRTKDDEKLLPKFKAGIGRVPEIKPGSKYADGMPYNEVKVRRVQADPAPEPLHLAQELLRLREADAPSASETGVGSTPASSSTRRCRSAGALPRHPGLPLLQQRVHPAPAHPVPGRLSRRRSRDRLQVPAPRHPEVRRDRRPPDVPGDYRIKFKAEVLPLKDELGGMRMLYSHNVELSLSSLGHEEDRTSLAALTQIFPPLAALRKHANEGRAGQRHHRRGSAGHRHARLRRRRHGDVQRRAVRRAATTVR